MVRVKYFQALVTTVSGEVTKAMQQCKDVGIEPSEWEGCRSLATVIFVHTAVKGCQFRGASTVS